jgi:hypothetical protein
MAEKDIIAKETLKYTGYCDFRELYKFMYDWLKDEECRISEDEYKEKIKGDEKELDIKWSISKKLTDYFKLTADIKITTKRMKDLEVEIDGKKKAMNQLELKIDIKGVLVKDYTSKWSGSSSGKFFKELYDKFIIPKRTEDMEGKVESLVQELKEEVKAFLELTGKK